MPFPLPADLLPSHWEFPNKYAIVGAIEAEVSYVPDVVRTEPRAIPAIVSPAAPATPVAPSLPPVSFLSLIHI